MFSFRLNREYVFKCCRLSNISIEVGRIDNFRALARKLSFLPTELDIFLCTATLCTYFFYLSTSDLLSFIIFNTDQHGFSSKWVSRCNDVMNHIDCVIKRDVYPQKMRTCSRNIRAISFFLF